jgi:hypothetical protein
MFCRHESSPLPVSSLHLSLQIASIHSQNAFRDAGCSFKIGANVFSVHATSLGFLGLGSTAPSMRSEIRSQVGTSLLLKTGRQGVAKDMVDERGRDKRVRDRATDKEIDRSLVSRFGDRSQPGMVVV